MSSRLGLGAKPASNNKVSHSKVLTAEIKRDITRGRKRDVYLEQGAYHHTWNVFSSSKYRLFDSCILISVRVEHLVSVPVMLAI